jgi:hypothetical protein
MQMENDAAVNLVKPEEEFEEKLRRGRNSPAGNLESQDSARCWLRVSGEMNLCCYERDDVKANSVGA